MNEQPAAASAAADDRPETLDALVAALTALPGLDPVERARAIPGLIEASKSVLARQRGAAMAEATGPGRLSQGALAAELGIHRSKVVDAIALHRGTERE